MALSLEFFPSSNYTTTRAIRMAPLSLRPNSIPSLNPSKFIKTTARALPLRSVSENIQHNVWPDYFLKCALEDTEILAYREEQVSELKEEVRKELWETIAHKPVVEQLEIIDDIERLGVGYHFENEIEEALKHIYESHSRPSDVMGDDLDLNHASLKFRLLRQHGYYVSCDMFKKYLDGNGKFQTSLSADVDGMLSLYEASHLRTHGDDILDEALTFTTHQLKLMVDRLSAPLSSKVARALDQPLHKSVARLEARHYISLYELIPCHKKNLLQFAKLDYNLVQSLHKKEAQELTRWCFDGGMDVYIGLPCNVRDQIAEVHYSAIGTCDERPEYSLGRMIYFKTVLVGTIIDDLYDVCDIEDLKLLTEAIQRWEKGCVNQLPNSLQPIYIKLLDTFEEIEQQLTKEGRINALNYAVDAFKILWPHHMKTRKWKRDKYVPTLEEYLTTAPAAGFKFLTIIGWLGVGEFTTEEASKWAQHYSKAIDGLCTFYRIMDDLAEDYLMDENTTDELSVVSCYMKQHDVREKTQVYAELQKIIDNIWKDFNFALLRPFVAPMPLLQRFVTQARFLHIGFYKGDGFTFPDKTPMRENCRLLYKDPIPM